MINQKNKSIYIHIIGSILFLSLPFIFSPDLSQGLELFKIKGFQRHLFSFLLLLIYFYLNYFLFIPSIYFKKKHLLFIFITLISVLIICFLPILIFSNDQPPHPINHPIKFHKNKFWLIFSEHLFRSIAVFALSFLIKIYSRWKQSEKEKLDAELSYLKAQINPHFLFNTLNSIYAQSIEENAYKTSGSIIELSKMMRYVLTDSQHQFVALEKEINYIKSYIELQKLRLGNTINLHYNIEMHLTGKQIAPLILIPFIENAFKHGINPEEESKIIINIFTSDKEIILDVKNKKVSKSIIPSENNGIGIENTKNRLLHLYPNKHLLEIIDSEKEYNVTLKIKLID